MRLQIRRLARSFRNVARSRTLPPWGSNSSTVTGSPRHNLSLYISVLRAAAIHLRGSHTATICELLGVTNDESPSVIPVDPAGPRSRYAIVCCMHAASPQITYLVCDNILICNFGIWIDMMVDGGRPFKCSAPGRLGRLLAIRA